MTQVVGEFAIRIDHVEGYKFRTHFDKEHFPELLTDEPAPLGQDTAPNPARILAAAVGNCLTASLLFCLTKAQVQPTGISADVKVELIRNENRRLRIGALEVTLHPQLSDGGATLAGCISIFEDGWRRLFFGIHAEECAISHSQGDTTARAMARTALHVPRSRAA